MTETFTVVAFRYDQKQSIYYKSFTKVSSVKVAVEYCLSNLKADVISIRRVYEKRPTNQSV